MGPSRPRDCCICRCKTRGKESKAELRSKWRISTKYEKDFEVCFGAAAEGRSGDLCLNCVNLVGVRFKNNPTVCFPDRLDKYLSGSSASVSESKDSNNNVNDNAHIYNSFLSPVTTSVLTSKNDVIPCSTPTTSSTTCSKLTTTHMTHVTHRTPFSPRKRNRSETENLPERVSRVRQEQDNNCVGDHVHVDSVVNVMIKLKSMPKEEIITFIFKELLPQHQTAIKNVENKLNEEKKRFDSFKTVSSEGPLTNPQKKMLNLLITNRENNKDSDGCIVVPQSGSGGKPRRYKRLPKVQISSKNAAKRTLNQRSQVYEQVEKIVSTSTIGFKSTSTEGIHEQRVNNIKRDMVNYAAAAEEAGLKIVTRFNKETVLSLRSIMTLRMWRLLKRVFHVETGWDVFGSVDEMNKEVKKVEFDYECGTVKSTTGETVHFVRVTDVKQVIVQVVSQLRQVNQLINLDNVPEDCLWLHASADKGGKTTKLILQVINQKERHSIHSAKLIGYFEGKDNRVNLETVFGPILHDLQECSKDIAGLNLQYVPSLPTQPVSHCQHPDLCDGTVRWTPLMPFNSTNTTVSMECTACRKSCRCSNNDPPRTSTHELTPSTQSTTLPQPNPTTATPSHTVQVDSNLTPSTTLPLPKPTTVTPSQTVQVGATEMTPSAPLPQPINPLDPPSTSTSAHGPTPASSSQTDIPCDAEPAYIQDSKLDYMAVIVTYRLLR